MDQFITAYKTALSRYVDFTGRTSVGGFWRFVAINFVVALALGLLGSVSSIFFVLYALYALAVLLPSLAIAVRRLHDTGKNLDTRFIRLAHEPEEDSRRCRKQSARRAPSLP